MGLVGCGLSSDYRTTPVNIVQLCTGLGCGNMTQRKICEFFWTPCVVLLLPEPQHPLPCSGYTSCCNLRGWPAPCIMVAVLTHEQTINLTGCIIRLICSEIIICCTQSDNLIKTALSSRPGTSLKGHIWVECTRSPVPLSSFYIKKRKMIASFKFR